MDAAAGGSRSGAPAGPRDILAEQQLDQQRQRSGGRYRRVTAQLGMVIEDRASGFCGDVVKITIEAVTLRDRADRFRHFRWKDGAFLLEGEAITLVRADAPAPPQPAGRVTNSGSVASAPAQGADRPRAVTAKASRIWVEGIHDAELIEHVWGDDLREAAIVVEALHGIDDLAAAVARFGPQPQRRLGVLVDHLVAGSKESRIVAGVHAADVLITGHPFVDIWAGIRPAVIGLREWPEVALGEPWKDGICRALGADPATFWPRLRSRVGTYADLRPELVGAVERLIDFVTVDDG